MNWLLILIYIVFSVGGQVLFKYGSNKKFLFALESGNIHISVNWLSILGGGCYIISFLLYLMLLSKYNLNKIIPILVGMTYSLSFLSSIFVLKEPVAPAHLLGGALILIGVLLLCKGNLS